MRWRLLVAILVALLPVASGGCRLRDTLREGIPVDFGANRHLQDATERVPRAEWTIYDSEEPP